MQNPDPLLILSKQKVLMLSPSALSLEESREKASSIVSEARLGNAARCIGFSRVGADAVHSHYGELQQWPVPESNFVPAY